MSNERLDDSYFVIEPDRLLEQWSVFARDYYHRSLETADARENYEIAKRALDVVEAELARDVRANPEDYGLTKAPSIPVVEQTVLLQKKYATAHQAVVDAEHALDIRKAVMGAMDAMKKGLEATTYLQQNAMYAEPRVRGNVAEA